MEGNNKVQPKPTPAPSGGGVMDVQAPQLKSTAPETPPVPPTASAPGVVPGPVPAPAANSESEDSKKPESGLSPELLAQAEAETKKSDTKPNAPKIPKNRGPIVVIALAIIVALSLAGLAIYAYLQSQESSPTTQPVSDQIGTEDAEPAEVTPATSQEIEDMSKELDDAINATPEDEEIPDGGLSEDTVGL